MKGCIYARTSRREKQHQTSSIANQIEDCRALARKHNRLIEPDHVYTDVELEGFLTPSCWAQSGESARPALSMMIESIEEGGIGFVFVRRLECLATSSDLLGHLRDFFRARGVWVVADRELALRDRDPAALFAQSVLKPCLRFDTRADRERTVKTLAKKRDERDRLAAKLERLDVEISELTALVEADGQGFDEEETAAPLAARARAASI